MEIAELRDILLIADKAAEWREIALRPPEAVLREKAWEGMQALSLQIADFTSVLRYFRNKILPDGTLDDRASAELGRIRREVEKQKRQIQDSCAGTCGGWRKVAQCRKSWSRFVGSAL